MSDPQQNSRDSATHHPASGTLPPARTSVPATPQVSPQEGKLEARVGENPGPAQAAGQRPTRRKRNEAPGPVVDVPSSASPAAREKSAGEVSTARHLEAMVGELLRKLRKSEKQLKESESALDRLREQTVSMSRELAEPNRRGAGGLSLESVDFFGSRPLSRNGGRPAPNGRVKSANPEKAMRARDPRTVRPRAHAAALWRPGQCPSCGEKLLRAKSVNIITLVCLRCRGIFIDQRSLHQLAGTQNWFRSVERFLSASARVATGAPKSGRLSRARGR